MKKSVIIKSILMFGIVSAVISLMLACVGFGVVEFYKIKHESISRINSQMEILAYNLQPMLLFDDKEEAKKILRSLASDRSINNVRVYKAGSGEFASYVGAKAKSDLKVAKDIIYDNKLLGRIEVESAFMGIWDKYIAYFLISLLIIIISIPASYFISAPIRAQVSKSVIQLEQQSSRLRLLANELSETEQRERKRFARLLHDHLQQLLVASKLRLDLMEKKIDKITMEDLSKAKMFVEQAIAAARSLTTELRPPVLYEGGLAPALRFLSRKFEEQYHFKVNLDIKGRNEPDSDIVKWMLYSAVEELLLNVVKYAEVKECFISMDITEERISLRVMDYGKGFNPDILDTQKEGGFGLFSIRERIHALEGNFNITSVPGQGSTFELSVPYRAELEEENKAQIQKTKDKQAILKEAMGELAMEGSVRILVADDHDMVRQAISAMLNTHSAFKVIAEAEDGEEAVRKTFELNPDVVIMDLNMPRLNGIAATRMIKHRLPGVKVIGLSVQDEKTVSDAMREAGAVAFFNKSAGIDKLIETINACVKPRPFATGDGTVG